MADDDFYEEEVFEDISSEEEDEDEALVDDDEMTAEEEGFIKGYKEADKKFREYKKNKSAEDEEAEEEIE